MISKSIISILFSSIAVVAAAEPSVYYCNTTGYAQVERNDVRDIQSYPFKLFIDLENRQIKIAGSVDFAMELKEGEGYARVRSWQMPSLGKDAFFAHNTFASFIFESNTLLVSELGATKAGGYFVNAAIARCDKF